MKYLPCPAQAGCSQPSTPSRGWEGIQAPQATVAQLSQRGQDVQDTALPPPGAILHTLGSVSAQAIAGGSCNHLPAGGQGPEPCLPWHFGFWGRAAQPGQQQRSQTTPGQI